MTMRDSLTQLVLSGEVRGAQARRLLLGALPGSHVRLRSWPMSGAPAVFTDWAQLHPRLIFSIPLEPRQASSRTLHRSNFMSHPRVNASHPSRSRWRGWGKWPLSPVMCDTLREREAHR
jgi:hypothetical protein